MLNQLEPPFAQHAKPLLWQKWSINHRPPNNKYHRSPIKTTGKSSRHCTFRSVGQKKWMPSTGTYRSRVPNCSICRRPPGTTSTHKSNNRCEHHPTVHYTHVPRRSKGTHLRLRHPRISQSSTRQLHGEKRGPTVPINMQPRVHGI